LLVPEGVGAAVELGMVGMGSVLGLVKIALGVVQLLLQQAMLRGDGGQ
jgi:hypothetical protein